MVKRGFGFILIIMVFCSCQTQQDRTLVEIRGEQFFINGRPTYDGKNWRGHTIEGLLINSRMVQGIFDDLNPLTRELFVYPDTKNWDADRNTNEFVESMEEWYSYGMNSFTLNMQGGSPTGYGNKDWLNPAYNPDGSLMNEYMHRLDNILKRADELEMVVILGLFYFGQDQHLEDEQAVINATKNVINWLFDKGYKNVLIEINNESRVKKYEHEILRPDRVHELINMVKGMEQNGFRFLVSTSFLGKQEPYPNVAEVSDFILIHGNGAHDYQQIQELIDRTRQVDGYSPMPVVINEDDHYEFEEENNNFTTAIENYVSWGFFDFRRDGEDDIREGYQSVPVDWGINSDRKKAFFNKVKEITGGNPFEETILNIYFEPGNAQAEFAVEELRKTLSENGIGMQETDFKNADLVLLPVSLINSLRAGRRIEASIPPDLGAEGFSIRKTGDKSIWVVGADAAGVMYGGLELAEQIRLYGLEGVRETDQNPYIEMRGTKFNIPLDVRTPSYTDMSDVAQYNISEMWSFDFWKEYIDNLARYRYNYISLWSLHPFPSMVRVPEYPDVALDDVRKSTASFEEYYSTRTTDLGEPEILDNYETVLEISIDEKIEFWRKVMKYGKDRNINFYVITWNIYVYGTNGQYGITEDITNETTKDYFRKSVTQMFRTYPDLAGIGLTVGENMGTDDSAEKENWAFDTYAQGVMDAAREQPERQIQFIHRQHETGAKDIARKFKPLNDYQNIEFLFSFKYAKAHAMSCVEQPYHEDFVKDIEGLKTIWTLRNDDNYYFRWGAPDFVREFMKNIPTGVTKGYYYGSDQYVWGREFLSLEPETPRQLEIVKHWYHWMLWGRLGYNPDLQNDRLISVIQEHFGEIDAAGLFRAWQEASMIYPVTNGFHWTTSDYKFYIEGCKGRPRFTLTTTGFHDVNNFISIKPHPLTGYQSIPDYVNSSVEKKPSELADPLEVSRLLHNHADSSLAIIESLNHTENKELFNTLNDIQAMAYLGKYYACKIHGAAQLALFRETGDKRYKDEAVAELIKASEYWEMYSETAMSQYKNPLWTNRVGHVDWLKIAKEVKNDIAIAASDPGPPH